ncbi:hypothetical protein Ae406Ps2_6474c [Pseudonocardia sp. Ae406_Ps2]|nr:hypothetical protein Ae406Ps2_6474c [Pseudonocardia sp. Ae406_Ps2]
MERRSCGRLGPGPVRLRVPRTEPRTARPWPASSHPATPRNGQSTPQSRPHGQQCGQQCGPHRIQRAPRQAGPQSPHYRRSHCRRARCRWSHCPPLHHPLQRSPVRTGPARQQAPECRGVQLVSGSARPGRRAVGSG